MDEGRRNTATEFSYILQRQASDESVEEHAFDDIKSLMKNDNTKSDTMSTLSQTSFNYINSIVGSGVIGIPYAFHRAGFGLGFLLLILVAVITDYSLILMVRCGHLCGRFSYPGIMEAAYGKWGYYFLSLLQFMYPFLAMISYNVVVGDTLSKVLIRFIPSLETSMGIVRFGVVFAVTVCIVIPLCLYKNVSRLARASFISLACVVFILFAVICKFFSGDYDAVPDNPESWRFAHIDVIPATGIMAFAFMCHHNTFLVYQSMRNASLERWEKVTHISIGFAFCVAALFGIAGYATFRALSQGDLLENYCWDDDFMNFSRILFSISILLTFPIECFVSREIVKAQIDRSKGIESSDLDKERDPSLEKGDNDESSIKITLAIVLTAFIISPMTECLGPVLELNGLLAAIPLAYILPGLAYIQMEPHSLTSREKLPAVGLVVFGTIVTVAGAAVLLPGILGDCKSNIDLGYCKSYEDTSVSPSENIFRFAYLLAFLFSITVQTFLYTYYGNGILETSNSLSNAVYFSKWYKMLPELGQTLVIFMERLKRKSEILAGSLFPLNLELFAKEMPLVGLGGYMLSRHGNQEPTPIAQPELCGEFSKLKISSSCDRISGKLFLNFSLHRCSYDGIKIRLNLHLKPVVTERVSAAGGEVDLFEHCPIETSLPGGIFRAQKRLNFILDIPKNQICPTSFISSQGSLTYRLVALITRDKHVTWTVISNKLLLDFKGYYNISGLELGPSVDFKQFFEEKITAIFTINKPVLLIGHDTNLNATLELEGVRDYSVDVTVTLQRRTKCAENVRADIILLQKQQADCREETTVFKWDFNVPNISRATYANELTPVYSVRYFAKYEATFKPLNDEDGIYVDGIGFIEVKVGTTSDTSSSSTVANRFDNLTLASRSESVASLMTLPPPYSQLSSRSGSVLSLETQPPGYDDLY